eukprot:scaffold63894_cov59-Phaeocystis_antarctica.AAC.4
MTSASNLCCRALGGAAPLMWMTTSWLRVVVASVLIRGTREFAWAGTGLCWRCAPPPSSIAISASASAASCSCLELAPARTTPGASSPLDVLADDSRALAVPSKPVELCDDRATTRPLPAVRDGGPGGSEGGGTSDGAGPAASLESCRRYASSAREGGGARRMGSSSSNPSSAQVGGGAIGLVQVKGGPNGPPCPAAVFAAISA